jgi:hypothetical protein
MTREKYPFVAIPDENGQTVCKVQCTVAVDILVLVQGYVDDLGMEVEEGCSQRR